MRHSRVVYIITLKVLMCVAEIVKVVRGFKQAPAFRQHVTNGVSTTGALVFKEWPTEPFAKRPRAVLFLSFFLFYRGALVENQAGAKFFDMHMTLHN